MKKYIIVMIACMLLLAGCEKGNEDSMSNTDNATEARVEYVTAKEFMEYYSITEDQVPADYVQAYIEQWRVTTDDLKKDEDESFKKFLISDYENGVIYGYNIYTIFLGEASNEKLSEYMKQADVIMFTIETRGTCGSMYLRHMVIDLREGKIYFSYSEEKIYTDDYINWLAAELSDEDVAAIRKEIPEHIAEDKNIKDSKEYDYSISIQMRAADWTTKYFQDYGNRKVYFPGIDEYWKGLYKKYFGEEYEFTP